MKASVSCSPWATTTGEPGAASTGTDQARAVATVMASGTLM
jgi:hypothetical protein